jgi:hypothetical protein
MGGKIVSDRNIVQFIFALLTRIYVIVKFKPFSQS